MEVLRLLLGGGADVVDASTLRHDGVLDFFGRRDVGARPPQRSLPDVAFSGLQVSLRVFGQTFGDALVRERSSLRMVVLALVPIRALLGVGTGRRGVALFRLGPQEVIQGGSGTTQRVVGRHESVVHEAVHQDPLFDHLTELGALLAEVSVVVVAHHDAVHFGGQPQDVAVIVADHPLAADETRRGEHEQSFFLQFGQDVLVANGVVWTGRLLAPFRDEHGDVLMAAGLEPVHADLDPPT